MSTTTSPSPTPAPGPTRSDIPAILLTGITRTFRGGNGPVEAVGGVDLRIDQGEVVALLGPNGAGKTTTLDIVLGLIEPTTGTARVMGRAPRGAVTAGRVSAVLQTGGLLADLTVRETVRYVAATFRPEHRATVDDVLDRSGLTDLADRRVSKCSGGEQQRLRFALALLPDPELLVLDEPTAGMDVTARRRFWAAMHNEADRGRTVVFATHYLEEANQFADRIVLLAGGRVVADGSTAEIRSRATGRIVTAHVPDPAAARRHLLRLRAGVRVEAEGSRLTVRTDDSDAVARLLLTELDGSDLEIASGSLDDAFLALTADADSTAPAGADPDRTPTSPTRSQEDNR